MIQIKKHLGDNNQSAACAFCVQTVWDFQENSQQPEETNCVPLVTRQSHCEHINP